MPRAPFTNGQRWCFQRAKPAYPTYSIAKLLNSTPILGVIPALWGVWACSDSVSGTSLEQRINITSRIEGLTAPRHTMAAVSC
jgi:hypothetical protein